MKKRANHAPSATQANTPAATIARLAEARKQVEKAEEFRLAGKLERAASTCAGVLKQFPDYVAALQTMGLVLGDQGQHERAIGLLQRAAMLHPDDPKIITALSAAYIAGGYDRPAAATLERARALTPDDPAILVTLGEIYRQQKEYEKALASFRSTLDLEPDFSQARLGLAMNLIQIGQIEEAADILHQLLEEGEQPVAVLYWLSQMPAHLVKVDLLAELEKLALNEGHAAADRSVHIAFTQAAALDRAGHHEAAWQKLQEARAHSRKVGRTGYERSRKRHEPLLALASRPVSMAQAEEALSVSLFITGPSRAGKTTLERLLGTCMEVKRGFENPIVENAVERTFHEAGLPPVRSILDVPVQFAQLFHKHYSEELRSRAEGASVFTNTMPGRIEDAMRVAQLVPNARFVFMTRNPEDLTLRIHMRNYRTGNYYAANLADTRDYVAWCAKMAEMMAKSLGNHAILVDYEELVTSPQSVVANVVKLCGIEWTAGDLPSPGDDRGCSVPYAAWMSGSRK